MRLCGIRTTLFHLILAMRLVTVLLSAISSTCKNNGLKLAGKNCVLGLCSPTSMLKQTVLLFTQLIKPTVQFKRVWNHRTTKFKMWKNRLSSFE